MQRTVIKSALDALEQQLERHRDFPHNEYMALHHPQIEVHNLLNIHKGVSSNI